MSTKKSDYCNLWIPISVFLLFALFFCHMLLCHFSNNKNGKTAADGRSARRCGQIQFPLSPGPRRGRIRLMRSRTAAAALSIISIRILPVVGRYRSVCFGQHPAGSGLRPPHHRLRNYTAKAFSLLVFTTPPGFPGRPHFVLSAFRSFSAFLRESSGAGALTSPWHRPAAP